ncbi:hypothetical protein D3C76_1206750 [compost metagenome]
MGQQNFGESLELFALIHRTGGVGRRVENQPTGVWSDRLVQCLRGQLEARFRTTGDNARFPSAELHHFWVADPVRSRDDDFVTFVEGCCQGIEDDLLAAAAYEGVLPADVQSIFPLVLARDRFSQGTEARDLGVAGVAVVDCAYCGCTDVLRCIEVWLTGAKRNDPGAFGPARSHTVNDLVGCRRLGSLQATVQGFQAHACSSG